MKRERVKFRSLPIEIRQQVYRNVLVKPVGIALGSPAWRQCMAYCHKLAIVLGQNPRYNEALPIFLGENMFAYSVHCPEGCPTEFGRQWPWSAIKRFRLNFYVVDRNRAYWPIEAAIATAIQLMTYHGFQPKQFELRLDMNTLCAYYVVLNNTAGYQKERVKLVRTLQQLRPRVQQQVTISLHGRMAYFDEMLNMSGLRTFGDLRRALGQEEEWDTEVGENRKEDFKSVS